MKSKNVPYVKKYENGVLLNPITKENPHESGQSTKGESKLRRLSNSKGFGLIVSRIGRFTFQKYHKKRQLTPDSKIIEHLIAK
jgi:hypothetical protein